MQAFNFKKSHNYRRFPNFYDVKRNSFEKVKVYKGGILILNTLLYAGLPNYSKTKNRSLIVAHYTPEFVKRRLDIAKLTKKSALSKDKKQRFIRSIIGLIN